MAAAVSQMHYVLPAAILLVSALAITAYSADYMQSSSGRFGEVVSPSSPEPAVCRFEEKKNSLGDNCYNDKGCGTGQCCDYKLDPEGSALDECVCHSSANPCGSDPAKCLACIGYAEAGGDSVPDECMAAVMCTAVNRANDDKNYPGLDSACEAIAQGNGVQYNAYACVCNNQDKNQKYCECCSGKFKNDREKAEAEDAKGIAETLECSGFPATHFNSKGQKSWASMQKNCEKVPGPPGCADTFDFYRCYRP